MNEVEWMNASPNHFPSTGCSVVKVNELAYKLAGDGQVMDK